jgi:hypothetical protein
MKLVISSSLGIAATLLSAATVADCSGEGFSIQLQDGSLSSALSGKRILATAPAPSNEDWKEDHCANGNLFKVGVSPTDPVDPRAYRGTWTVNESGASTTVTYSYTVGGSYTTPGWTLWKNDSDALCWEDSGNVIATTASAPAEIPAELDCNAP